MKRLIFLLWIAALILCCGSMRISSTAQSNPAANFTEIRGIDLHPNGEILAIGGRYNDQPGIWFYELSTEAVTGIPTAGNVSMLSWRPDGNAIAASVAVGNDMIQIFDVVSGTMLFEFVAESGRKQVLWSSDGSKFMTQGDSAYLRDGNTGAVLQAFAFPGIERRALTGIAWSETYHRLYGAFDVDRELIVWDTINGNVLTSFTLPFVSWGPQLNHAQGLLAIGSNEGDGQVLIFDALTGEVLQDLVYQGGGFITLTPLWSPDDSKLAVPNSAGEPSPIWIWEVETGRILHGIPVKEFVSSQVMAWSGDGESLLFSDGGAFPARFTLSIDKCNLRLSIIDNATRGTE
jgi:WD40 repeat protein